VRKKITSVAALPWPARTKDRKPEKPNGEPWQSEVGRIEPRGGVLRGYM